VNRIAVFGETLVDHFETGPVVGGAPFNVARHLAAFGHAPLMVSAVGTDVEAQPVMAEFARYGLGPEGVQHLPSHPTGAVDVETLADGGHAFRIRTGSAWDHIELAPARIALAGMPAGGWLYCGTLALRAPVSRATGLALMHGHGGPIYLDLNWRDGHVDPVVALGAVQLAQVLKVNEEELQMLCGWLGGTAAATRTAELAAAFLLERVALGMLLVTCGPAGALAFDGTGRCLARGRNARPVQLVDSVGAGDSFSAVMLAGFLRDWPLSLALERANTFAGHICEVRGAVPAHLASYAAWTAGWT